MKSFKPNALPVKALLLVGVCFLATAAACASARGHKALKGADGSKDRFRQGKIESEGVKESSGIVASRQFKDVFWTHNDSGNAPVLYAITREGKAIAEFPVDVKNEDWEDIAIDDEGHLYIAETGNNEQKKIHPAVYRVTEPDPRVEANAGKVLKVNRVSRLKYPDDKPFDCEALFVLKGAGYIIPKYRNGQHPDIYRFDLAPKGEPAVLESVATLPIRSPVTAADISADGKQLAVLTVTGPYLFQIDGDVSAAGKVEPKNVLYIHAKHEGVCFVSEGLLTTTEERDIFLFKWKDFGIEEGKGNDNSPNDQ